MPNANIRIPRHETGRYARHFLCDCCGGTVLDYLTDAEVCGGSDGPGFILCDRVRCEKRRDIESVEERRALYAAQRAENRTALDEGRKPRLAKAGV